MSDLHQLWQEISAKTALPVADTNPAAPVRLGPSPHNLLVAILRRTRLKLYLIYFYLAINLALLGWFHGNWETLFILLAMFLFGLVNLGLVLPPYLQMKHRGMTMSAPSRVVLEFYYASVRGMLRQENLIGALFTPFSAMLGFLWAFIEKSGTAAEVFTNWRLWGIMLVTALAIAPLGAWAVRWMNRKSFGLYMAHLKDNLAELQPD